MSAPMYNSLMLVLMTLVLVEAKPDSSMTYTVDGGDSRPVTSHQHLTICSGVYVKLSVCVHTARPGSLLHLKVRGQTTTSFDTCVRVVEMFSTRQHVVFSYNKEKFVFNVEVYPCVESRKCRKCRRLPRRGSSPATSWINSGSITGANSGQSTSRLRYPAPKTLDQSYMSCPKLPARQPDILSNGIRVLCDTVTDGGDWIVIQRRTNGEVDFYRDWAEYVSGFGDATREHWLGLENIHTLCPPSRPCRLRVDLMFPQYLNGTLVWAEYSSFSLSGSSDNYRLSISGFDARSTVDYDSLADHDGQAFSTKDRDNDESRYNCAAMDHGAWWYYGLGCFMSNLNGKYGVRYLAGVAWYSDKEYMYMYATYTEMKIRVMG